MNNYIFDSYSLITFFEKDINYEKVIDYFKKASNNEIYILMSVINWGEIYYIILREQGLKDALLFEENFSKIPVKLVYPDIKTIKKAAEFKAFNPISYADSIAAATASINNGILVTGDKEFKLLEKHIKIEWI